MIRKFSALSFLIIASFATHAFATPKIANPVDLQTYLYEFHRDPKAVMNTPLAKRDQAGQIISSYVPFGLNKAEMQIARNEVREKICGASGGSCEDVMELRKRRFAGVNEANLVQNFLYNPVFERRLIEIERRNLLQSRASYQPWSDSFWPTTKGLIGRRWNDPLFPNTGNWLDNYAYIQAVPSDSVSTDLLSPSEKYDLLIGDSNYVLTSKMWESGRISVEEKGSVPGWAGLCHGWAPAAIMEPNPLRGVTVQSVSGKRITFHPSDIKALTSLAWGDSQPRVGFLGKRCFASDPEEDEVGRVIDPNCFDINPGAWHLGVVHQLGFEKRSFVFDATYDYQVWNYPVYAYSYHYFNPQTLATSKSMNGMSVGTRDFTIDKFKKYRSTETVSIVGISMDVTYAVPTQPSEKPVPNSQYQTVRYVYDLELDQAGRIIGGEWYSNFHPDFIWNPIPGSRPLSRGELQLGTVSSWDGHSPLPPELLNAAKTSSLRGQPVLGIIEGLVARSRPQTEPLPSKP